MSGLFLRKAEAADAELLFKWANDAEVRAASFNTRKIEYDEHMSWFNRVMADAMVVQYILVDDGDPVGQIRINIEDDEAEISYSIAPEFRQKGYGHRILQLLHREVKKDYPLVKKLTAKVKPDNDASNRLFISEGFTLDYHSYSMDVISDVGEMS